MPYEAETLIENKVVLITVSGLVTLEEIKVGAAQANALLNACDAPAYIIMDVTDATEYPLNASAIYEASPFYRNPKLGHVVFIGVSTLLLNDITYEVWRMGQFEYTSAASLEKALAILRKQDSTL